MSQLMISVLVFVSVLCFGGAALMPLYYRRRLMLERLGRSGNRYRDFASTQASNQRFADRLSQFSSKFALATPSEDLCSRLTRAGFRNKQAAAIFLLAKLTLFVLGLPLFGLLVIFFQLETLSALMLTLVGASTLFMLPNLYVYHRQAQRTQKVRHHLPDAVDLLEVCVTSGMGLDMSWNAVADEIRQVCPILADEMTLTNLEMNLGVSRPVAMRHMAERTGADEMSSLVAVLIQSERFGTSIAEALRTFATSLRELRSQRAEERAEKMAVKLLFPMVVLIFPAVFIVAAGPAGITIYELFSQ